MEQKESVNGLHRGAVRVELDYLEGDVVSASGAILIEAPPDRVWQAITDYDNLHRTLPKVVHSRVVERHGNDVLLEQRGKAGILIFEITVRFRLQLHEEPLKRVTFEQTEGDFSLYRGSWELEPVDEGRATILRYHAEMKPGFFAPPILVSFVQRQDLPEILKAHRRTAETPATTT